MRVRGFDARPVPTLQDFKKKGAATKLYATASVCVEDNGQSRSVKTLRRAVFGDLMCTVALSTGESGN